MVDLVNAPPHYISGGLESIDIIEGYRFGFSLGNAVKYLLRAGRKTWDPGVDLQKAGWYLRRACADQTYDYQHGDAHQGVPSPDAVIVAFDLHGHVADAMRCLLVTRVTRSDVVSAAAHVAAAIK